MKGSIPIAAVALLTLFAVNGISQSATITTYAGPAMPVSGLPAVTQGIDKPTSVVSAGTGAFYVVSSSQSRVYLVARDGMLTVVV